MSNVHPHRVLATGLLFPEGPVALADGSIALCEIARGTVSRVSPQGSVEVLADVGGGPNGMAVGPDGALYVCNNGGFIWPKEPAPNAWLRPVPGTPPDYRSGSIQRVDTRTGEVRTLYERCGDTPLFGPNDLVFDREGGFYFTDMGRVRRRDRDIGSIYYALSDGSRIVEVVETIMQPNGIGLSPDQGTLYVAETETCRLWAFDIKAPGIVDKLPFPSPHGGRLVCGPAGYQRFDSLAVEDGGNICVATLVTGRVMVITPGGEIVREILCPDPQTTNLCFGGPSLTTAFVTQSYTGQLIAIEWQGAGLPLNF